MSSKEWLLDGCGHDSLQAASKEIFVEGITEVLEQFVVSRKLLRDP
jgi:hypothetical protein